MTNVRAPVLVVLSLGMLACGEDQVREGKGDTAGELDRPDAAEKSSWRLADLLERYPVLREAVAAEPGARPGADPTEVPERYRGVLPRHAVQAATGGATYYADGFEGQRTASGIPFRQNQMVAAHRGFPFGTILRVTNLANDRAVNVRVVDRGPFGGETNARRTIIDLSRRAATELGYVDAGRAQVRVEVLEWGEGLKGAS